MNGVNGKKTLTLSTSDIEEYDSQYHGPSHFWVFNNVLVDCVFPIPFRKNV